MMGRVLTANGSTTYGDGHDSLIGGVAEGFCAAVELSDGERDALLQLCRQRLDAFREHPPQGRLFAHAAASARRSRSHF
jgi:hypothetical protein